MLYLLRLFLKVEGSRRRVWPEYCILMWAYGKCYVEPGCGFLNEPHFYDVYMPDIVCLQYVQW